MSKPMTRSKPAAFAVAAMPTTPPAGPGIDRVLGAELLAAMSPPFDCMKARRGPSPRRRATWAT